ncbi:MAG: transcriptional regulator [Acidobacteria bacterium]|nr:transcriptional regulator [Acidobacteriota bacterium]
MPRNAEVIRQWEILRAIERARSGASIDALARQLNVSTRTIRRDLDALQTAGFPLYDDKLEGKTRWKLSGEPFKGLETGFTLSEVCALYFSRTLVECLAGSPFHSDLARAFARVERVLTPRVRRFLDRLPAIMAVKTAPGIKRGDSASAEIIARLVEATLYQRKAVMRYDSASSGRTKEYAIDPYRLVYAAGGLYLFGYVQQYREVRTFAVERIRQLSLLEERFDAPNANEVDEAFAHSLGVHQGAPQLVDVEFAARVAPYVKDRVWHASQHMTDRPDGSILLRLNVTIDWALRSWILSFGPFARVVGPPALAEEIFDELEEARLRYIPRLEFDLAPDRARQDDDQRSLPLETS